MSVVEVSSDHNIDVARGRYNVDTSKNGVVMYLKNTYSMSDEKEGKDGVVIITKVGNGKEAITLVAVDGTKLRMKGADKDVDILVFSDGKGNPELQLHFDGERWTCHR